MSKRSVLLAKRMPELIAGGFIEGRDIALSLRADEGMSYVDSVSVHCNEYREKWTMTAGQIGSGRSFLGDIWYAESEELEGLGVNARRMATHDQYCFYHPLFGRDNGRVVYFAKGLIQQLFPQRKFPRLGMVMIRSCVPSLLRTRALSELGG
ncbi:MAG: hypothetical protein M2R45_01207 [Verrucomicrobia subdivision 3 bacterium]|nr:hypothetical protein [Limisphaerales bacterium]MCS1415241.1 hypothetical protein [Limisphaerales bacterium]